MWKSLLSLTHSMCFMAQPRIRIWRKKRKKRAEHKKQRKFYSIKREALSVERWRGHTQMDSHIRIGWLTKTGLETQSKLKSVRSEFTRRSFFFFVCQLRVVVFFFALFSLNSILYAASSAWRVTRSKLTRAMTSDRLFFFRVNNSLLLSVVESASHDKLANK